MTNCIIIEDQLPAQRILKKYIDDTKTLQLIGTFTDAIEALGIINSEKVDLIFLDIHLPKLSGIDFLKTLANPPKVILTTAFSDYALESYELNVVDYLLKPFSFQRFIKAITKATTSNEKIVTPVVAEELPTTNEAIYIKSGHDHIRLQIEDIYYIKSDADYTELYLKDKKYLSQESLNNWGDNLKNKGFFRIHKSYIINTKKIVKISGNQIFIKDNTVIPIGRAFKNDFLKQYIT